MHSCKTLFLVALVGSSAAQASGAYAVVVGNADNEAVTMLRPAVPLTAAVVTAEQTAGSYATHAEYEKTAGGWAYDVDVVNGSETFDVRVDATSGQALLSTEDVIDGDRDEDGEHGEDKAD